MKIGMNLLLWTGHVTEEHFPLFDKLKAVGFDGAEIPIFDTTSPEHYRRIGQVAKDAGLELTAVAAFTEEDPLAESEAARSRAADHLVRVVERAHDSGIQLVVGPLYQTLGQFSGSAPTADERRRIADVHRRAAPAATAAGVEFSIEPLNRFEAYLLNTMEQGLAYLDELDTPGFGLLFDTFHTNIEEKDPDAALSEVHAAGRLNHIHISENDRGTPGRGHARIKETISIAKKGGYDGWLTIEAFGSAVPELIAATRVWRDFFPNPEQVYTEGYTVIREAWDAA